MKVWLIQNILAPYRIRLFENISNAHDIEFKLILLSKGMKNLSYWQFVIDELPFSCERIPGFSFHANYDNQISLNPNLFYKMLKEKPDVIICAGFSLATIQTCFYKLFKKRKYIIWMEGTKITESIRSFYLRNLERKILASYADAIIDAGTESKKYIKSLIFCEKKKPFFTSFNCVDNKKIYERCKSFKENYEEYNKFKNHFANQNILFVGQLIERKGVRELLSAYIKIFKQNKNIGLLMLGRGLLEEEIIKIKKHYKLNNLFMEGFISQDIYHKYLSIADLMIIPSIYDPNPLVLFEGLAAGLPILASYRAGNSLDFIVSGRNGYLIDPSNIADVVEKSLSVLKSNKDTLSKMSSVSEGIVKKANYVDSANAFVEACRHVMRQS
jgi:glycosyltransferase involved in cell wall biosynthesis